MYNNCRSRKPKKGGILSIIAFFGGNLHQSENSLNCP